MQKLFVSSFAVAVAGTITLAGWTDYFSLDPLRERVNAKVVALVKELSGRNLVIKGKTSFSLLSGPTLTLRDVSLAAAQDGTPPPLFQADSVAVRVKWWPLFRLRTEITEIRVTKPRLHLYVDKSGHPNWTNPSRKYTENPFADLPPIFLEDGKLIYEDRQNQRVANLENLQMRLRRASLRGLAVSGQFVWQKRPMRIAGHYVPAGKTGGQTPPGQNKDLLSFTLTAQGLRAAFNGTLDWTQSTGFALDGSLVSNGTSLRDVARLFGLSLPPGEGTFGRFSLSGYLMANETNLRLSQLRGRMDDFPFTAGLALQRGNERPRITAEITFSRLDLDRYLKGQGGPQLAPAPDWLWWADGALQLSIASLMLEGQTFGDLSFGVSVSKGAAVSQGKLTWRNEPISFSAQLTAHAPEDRQSPMPLIVHVTSQTHGKASFTGELHTASKPSVQGRLVLTVSSLRKAMKWLGQTPPLSRGLEAVNLTGQVRAEGEELALSGLKLRLDDLTAEGDVTLTLASERPKLTGDLTLGPVDLNPYFGEGVGSGDWDPTKLKALDMTLTLDIPQLQYSDVKLGAGQYQLRLVNGRLETKIPNLELYAGSLSGTVTVAAKNAVPSYAVDVYVKDVALRPLLTDLADWSRLSGKGRFDLKLSAAGKDMAALTKTLSGTASFILRNGVVRGFDLVKLLRRLKGGEGSWEPGRRPSPRRPSAALTVYEKVDGSFRVKNGVANNPDLRIFAPLFQIRARGSLHLPKQTLDYRAVPKLAENAGGYGSADPIWGTLFPVWIKGPWKRPRFCLEWFGTLFCTSSFTGGGTVRKTRPESVATPPPRRLTEDEIERFLRGVSPN